MTWAYRQTYTSRHQSRSRCRERITSTSPSNIKHPPRRTLPRHAQPLIPCPLTAVRHRHCRRRVAAAAEYNAAARYLFRRRRRGLPWAAPSSRVLRPFPGGAGEEDKEEERGRSVGGGGGGD